MIRHAKALDPFSGRWLPYQWQIVRYERYFSFDGWKTASRDRGRALRKANNLARIPCQIVA